MENKKPEIRVAGFNNDWEQLELGEISDIKTGPFGSTLHAKDYIESGIPIITTEHFKSGQLPENKSNTPQVSDEDYLRLKSYKLQKGDLVFSRVGSIDINALVTDLQDGWLFSGRVLRVRPNNQFHSGYLHYLLETTPVRNDVIARAVGQTMPSINTEILKKTKITTSTNVDEQNKIFSILKNIDSIASLHQQELDTLKQTKQGFLQKMFPKEGESVPELRFPEATEGWVESRLGDLMDVTSVKRIHQSDWTATGVRFLRARDIVAAFKKQKINDYIYISLEKYEEYSKKSGKVSVGDLLVTGVGSIGVPMLINNDEPIYFKDGNVIWFKNNGKMNGEFLYYSFENNKIQNYIRNVAGIGTVGTYTIDSGKNTPISFPSLEEQTKIGNFFNQLDEVIALHQQELDALKQTKKAFLQKMFV